MVEALKTSYVAFGPVGRGKTLGLLMTGATGSLFWESEYVRFVVWTK